MSRRRVSTNPEIKPIIPPFTQDFIIK
jgi:hypothetical protein